MGRKERESKSNVFYLLAKSTSKPQGVVCFFLLVYLHKAQGHYNFQNINQENLGYYF